MRKKRVLLIEDERGLMLALSDRLLCAGYSVQGAADGRSGYAMALSERFDLILLDLMLPDMDGFDICRDLHRSAVRAPILILSARGQLDDRVRGLKLGADDYLVKPFEPVELLTRMEVLLRRASRESSVEEFHSYRFGPIQVDFARQQVHREQAPIAVLPLEYRLLCYFIRNRDRVLTRSRLLDDVWGYDATPASRTVDVHVAGLRRKIEPDVRHPRYLLTVYHRGYKFVG
jgi:two-component system, OmpR family, alkaline phosphatase synthesis response regulator PhoP